MSTPQRIERPFRLNLTQRLRAAEAKMVEEPMLHGQKVKGWWLITPLGNFTLRGRGGPDTNAAALEMLESAGRQRFMTALMFGPSINEPAVVY